MVASRRAVQTLGRVPKTFLIWLILNQNGEEAILRGPGENSEKFARCYMLAGMVFKLFTECYKRIRNNGGRRSTAYALKT